MKYYAEVFISGMLTGVVVAGDGIYAGGWGARVAG